MKPPTRLPHRPWRENEGGAMSLAAARSQRVLKPNAKQQALAQLAELKSKGTRRSEQYEVRPYAPCIVKAVRNICASTILPSLTCCGLVLVAQVKDEGDVYDDVDEVTYQEIMKKRRDDNFIEDDGGASMATPLLATAA